MEWKKLNRWELSLSSMCGSLFNKCSPSFSLIYFFFLFLRKYSTAVQLFLLYRFFGKLWSSAPPSPFVVYVFLMVLLACCSRENRLIIGQVHYVQSWKKWVAISSWDLPKAFFQNELQKANKFFCCLIIKGSKCSVESVVGIRR